MDLERWEGNGGLGCLMKGSPLFDVKLREEEFVVGWLLWFGLESKVPFYPHSIHFLYVLADY